MKLVNPIPNFTSDKFPKGDVIQYFGENIELYKSIGLKNGHNGWDIIPNTGTIYGSPILAVTNGKITMVSYGNMTGGNEIQLQSPLENGKGYITGYYHLSKILVKMGDLVKAGDKIGEMGNSGFIVTGGIAYWGNNPPPDGKGSHLHFGIRPYFYDGITTTYKDWIDPNFIFNKKPMQIKTQNYKGELRVVLQADSVPTWEALCRVYGLDPTQIDETINA